MDWLVDLSSNTLQVMSDIGRFGPTVYEKEGMVKGHTCDEYGDAERTYYTSHDLRRIAEGCNEVAAWLDKRREQAT